jgi:ABC-type nitrate/sulfonate/bicarbonate transport system permease component
MKTKQKMALYLLSLISLLGLWQLLANQLNAMILASPWQTLMQLSELTLTTEFWQQLLVTLKRLLYALSIACSIGFILGLIAGRHAWLKFYLAPFRWLLMSVPPVIVVLLAMLWFGMGSTMVVFITVLLLAPTIYINTQKSVEQIDNLSCFLRPKTTMLYVSHYVEQVLPLTQSCLLLHGNSSKQQKFTWHSTANISEREHFLNQFHQQGK